jgi:polyisoprenoid-binding protein YceI
MKPPAFHWKSLEPFPPNIKKEAKMRKYLTLVILLITAILTFSCADPAADKTKATVGNAAPESNSPQPTGTETLVISPENSKVEFVASKVTRSHNGSFKQFSGKIELAPNSIPDSKVSIEIETGSVEADDPELTKHLKTPDFFDVAKFPKATFVSTKIEPVTGAAGTFTITGNLELHGVKKSISFPANIQVTPDSVSVNADFAINRKDFGIVFAGKADDLIRDGVVMKLALKVPRAKK